MNVDSNKLIPGLADIHVGRSSGHTYVTDHAQPDDVGRLAVRTPVLIVLGSFARRRCFDVFGGASTLFYLLAGEAVFLTNQIPLVNEPHSILNCDNLHHSTTSRYFVWAAPKRIKNKSASQCVTHSIIEKVMLT